MSASVTSPATTLESVPCDLCGSTDARPYLRVRDHIYGLPGAFQIVQCQRCGLLYINPRPDRASIGQYYPDLDYHAFKPASGAKAALIQRMRHTEARDLLAGISLSLLAERGQGGEVKVLEIGCGTGDLLVALREQGATVMGIEPNAAAVKVARAQNGLNVQIGMLADVLDGSQLAPVSFDLVLMKYALEHVHSPRQELTTISHLLKPGGRAVFWVPNADSWDARLFGAYWRGLDAPRHLYVFTPDTMRRLCALAGLTVRDISYSNVPNDWAGSVEFWLRDRGVPVGIARGFGIGSPPAMAAWLPISILAARLGKAGRMRVTAVKA
ncbi:MAG: class I SAM-dependent methyltransferase [Anaerolineae bacterium]|nr:class I SAM-dependent methyltransferase [Anaerolineae bacterium]